jgi:hypothetical protein
MGVFARVCKVSLLVLLTVSPVTAQQIDVPTTQLESVRDSTRIKAFYEMVGTVSQGQGRRPGGGIGPRIDLLSAQGKRQANLADALIRLLEKENAIVAAAKPGSLSEPYSTMYYPDVFVTVARLRNPRALKALIPPIGNGDVIATEVAALGDVAVPELIRALENSD